MTGRQGATSISDPEVCLNDENCMNQMSVLAYQAIAAENRRIASQRSVAACSCPQGRSWAFGLSGVCRPLGHCTAVAASAVVSPAFSRATAVLSVAQARAPPCKPFVFAAREPTLAAGAEHAAGCAKGNETLRWNRSRSEEQTHAKYYQARKESEIATATFTDYKSLRVRQP
jgi:hypothetical protein